MYMKRRSHANTTRHTIGRFPVIVHEDEDQGYWVQCPVLQGCYSQGETVDEALKNIREAIELCLEDLPKRERSFMDRDVSLHFVSV